MFLTCGASPRDESRLSGRVSLFSTDQRPPRVPKHEWNASCDGRCTRETTALEWNGPVDSPPAQGRTIIARALRRATEPLPSHGHPLPKRPFLSRRRPATRLHATNNARASNSRGFGDSRIGRDNFRINLFKRRPSFCFCARGLDFAAAATVFHPGKPFLIVDPWQASFHPLAERGYAGVFFKSILGACSERREGGRQRFSN